MDEELYKKIITKKEFSKLPKIDVEKAFKKFDNEKYIDEEKIKFTRDLLRKAFGVFLNKKLLVLKDRESNWILKKHISTKERFGYYDKLYNRLLGDIRKNITIFDLGAGVNGFSYAYFDFLNRFDYVAFESVGQLVDLMNYHFNSKGIKNCNAVHISLFELDKLKEHIKGFQGYKIVFLFKVIDSLEMIDKNYSKKLLKEIMPLVDKIVISFASESLHKRKKFFANRKWLLDFIHENFSVLDDFTFASERYLVLKSK